MSRSTTSTAPKLREVWSATTVATCCRRCCPSSRSRWRDSMRVHEEGDEDRQGAEEGDQEGEGVGAADRHGGLAGGDFVEIEPARRRSRDFDDAAGSGVRNGEAVADEQRPRPHFGPHFVPQGGHRGRRKEGIDDAVAGQVGVPEITPAPGQVALAQAAAGGRPARSEGVFDAGERPSGRLLASGTTVLPSRRRGRGRPKAGGRRAVGRGGDGGAVGQVESTCSVTAPRWEKQEEKARRNHPGSMASWETTQPRGTNGHA